MLELILFSVYLWQSRRSLDRNLELETWHDLANVYTSLSQWRDAEVCLSKSSAISPHSASRWHSTGILHFIIFFWFSVFLEILIAFLHIWLFWNINHSLVVKLMYLSAYVIIKLGNIGSQISLLRKFSLITLFSMSQKFSFSTEQIRIHKFSSFLYFSSS